jgi:hypothetical protein
MKKIVFAYLIGMFFVLTGSLMFIRHVDGARIMLVIGTLITLPAVLLFVIRLINGAATRPR